MASLSPSLLQGGSSEPKEEAAAAESQVFDRGCSLILTAASFPVQSFELGANTQDCLLVFASE